MHRVVSLTSLDVYRDGGSLSASFKEVDPGVEYCLLFPIENSPAFGRNVHSPSYKQPLLESYKTVPYVSSVTGVSNPSTQKESKAISWADARDLIEGIKPHVSQFESEYLWVFEAMVAAASKDGRP